MKNCRFVCFHGSPGTPKEFEPFEQYMSKNTEVIKNNRYEPEATVQLFSELKKDVVFIGYSWGAAEALLAAKQNLAQAQAVVLVSPYVMPTSLNPVKKALTGIPVVGSFLMSLLGPNIINDFMTKTCAPEAVPSAYAAVAHEIADPGKLKLALKEKESNNSSLLEALRIIKENNIPVGVLRGEEDSVDVDSQQIKFLRRYIDFAFEQKIPGAGHAIVWNHPRELADFVNGFLRQPRKQEE